MKATLESRDGDRLNILENCKQSFKLMTYEQINMRTTLEFIGKR